MISIITIVLADIQHEFGKNKVPPLDMVYIDLKEGRSSAW